MTVIPAKSAKKLQKSTAKTAKRPVLREKCAEVAEKPSRSPSRSNFGDKAFRFEAGDVAAKIAGSKGGTIKAIRRAILDDCARAAAKGDRLAKLFDDALNEPDPEIANQKMQLAERAAKFIGSTHDQSDDAKQKIELAGKLDNNLNVKIESVK
jgi:hypothetical protein